MFTETNLANAVTEHQLLAYLIAQCIRDLCAKHDLMIILKRLTLLEYQPLLISILAAGKILLISTHYPIALMGVTK